MSKILPWASGPFELLVHAELHLRGVDDFDRRMALISFDNAIEVAVTNYLSLNPINRGDREYKREDIDKWMRNYHSKLDFVDLECRTRRATWGVPRATVVWCHANRNDQYHGGTSGVPERRVLSEVRKAALWLFAFLYEIDELELRAELETEVARHQPPTKTPRTREFDTAIDSACSVITILGQQFYASEVLWAVDEAAYRTVATQLLAPREDE